MPGSSSRAVNAGSSWRTVPLPVRTAPERARQRCTSCRASVPVIQRLVPFASAVRPSRLAAILLRTQGRERRMRVKNPRFNSSCLGFEEAAVDADARGLELAAAAARERIRIAHRVHDARDTGLDQRPRARPRAPLMATRLQRHVRGRASRARSRGCQRHSFRVWASGGRRPAASNNRGLHARARSRRPDSAW